MENLGQNRFGMFVKMQFALVEKKTNQSNECFVFQNII